MAIGWNAEMPVGERMPTTRLRAYAARLLSWLFGRKGVDEVCRDTGSLRSQPGRGLESHPVL